MRADWKVASLREAGVQLIDCDHRTPPAAEAGYPYVAIPQIKNGRIDLSNARRITREHFVEWTRKAHPQAFDVVLSRRCNPGETACVAPETEFALGQNLVLLRAEGSRVYPPFLRWLVRGREWWEQVRKFINVGAVFDSLRCADVPNFELTIPTLKEQRAIAHVLGALYDKIELNRRMNETLQALSQALFRSRFVDPIENGLTNGWREATISDLVELRVDRIESTPAKDAKRYIALEDMPSTSIDLSGYQPGSSVNSSIIAFRKGDILFGSMRPYFHKVGLAFFDGITRTTTFVMRPKDEAIRHFALFHLFSNEVVDFATTASVGTTIPYVKWDALQDYVIAVPPKSELSAFETSVAPLVQRIAANGEESRMLASLRDALLPKLLSGAIRLKSAKVVTE